MNIETIMFIPSSTAQKIKFSIKDFFSKCDQMQQFPADLVTFTEETLNGKFHFLCSVVLSKSGSVKIIPVMKSSRKRSADRLANKQAVFLNNLAQYYCF